VAIEASRNPLDNKGVIDQGLNCDFNDSLVCVIDNQGPNCERLGLLFMGLNTAVFY
jgi:hypothetical protein